MLVYSLKSFSAFSGVDVAVIIFFILLYYIIGESLVNSVKFSIQFRPKVQIDG